MKSGDMEGALATWRRAIRLDSKEHHPYKNLADALHERGDLDGAIAIYQDAVAANPTSGLPYNDWVHAWWSMMRRR